MDNSTSLTGMVNLKATHIKNKDVSQWLKVPRAKDVAGKVGYLNKPWREVFQDGNFYFLFEDHPTKMTMDMVVMSIAS